MRRLTLLLAALLLPAGYLAPAQAAPKVPYAPHTYRACYDHHGQTHFTTEHPEVCFRATITRQSDGWGWNVSSIYAYAYNDAGNLDCFERGQGRLLFDSPVAVDIEDLTVSGERTDGTSVTHWARDYPNLTEANSCKVTFSPGVSANNEVVDVYMRYTPHLVLAPDRRTVLNLRVGPGGFECTNDTEECSMVS